MVLSLNIRTGVGFMANSGVNDLGSSGFRVGWREIQPSTMKVDRGLEMLDVPEAARRSLDPLNRGIDCLQTGVGDPVLQIRRHVGQMPPDLLGDRGHRL